MKNLFVKTLAIVAVVIAAAVQTMAQESFAYQAVIRNAEGELIANQDVNLKFSLSNGGKTYYTETQQAKTNQYGNISVEVGKGKAEKGAMSDVPWETLDITLKVEVQFAGDSKFITLGETKINPAPYALYAPAAGGAAVVNGAAKDNGNLFEVTDRDGNPVFAVTDDGIVVYVDDSPDSRGDKARRSGFIVTGRTATKNGDGDLFAVTAEGTKVYVDDPDSRGDKTRRSGFIVTGRTATKNSDGDLFAVNDEGTKVYVDATEEDKARRSGFVVTGRTATKDADTDIFAVDAATTTVYVDDLDGQNDKARRSGFIVTGRTATKDSKIIDINSSRTNLVTNTMKIGTLTDTVASVQISEEQLDFKNDAVFTSGIRPVIELNKSGEYSVYMTDNYDAHPTGYDFVDNYGSFYFDMDDVVGYSTSYSFCNKYNRLASLYDNKCVPLSTKESWLLLNADKEETAIVEDAVVAIFIEYRYSYYRVYVWPLRQFNDFDISFAMTDYYQTSFYSGSASEYVQVNVILNNSKPYAGCNVEFDRSPDPYTVKVSSISGTTNLEVGRYDLSTAQVVLGETVTLEITDIPDGRLLDYWLVDGHRYTGNTLQVPVSSKYVGVSAVFKDEAKKLWVDGSFKPVSDDVVLDGSEDKPYNTIAEAVAYIAQHGDKEVDYRINISNISSGNIELGSELDNKAQHIIADFVRNASLGYGDTPDLVNEIRVNTTVPTVVKYCYAKPTDDQTGSVIIVDADNARLTLEYCSVGEYQYGYNLQGAQVNRGELVLLGSSIQGFTADYGGGAVVAKDATLTVKSNSFITGHANYLGGAVFLNAGANLYVSNSSVYDYDNNSRIAGKAVFANGVVDFKVEGRIMVTGIGLADGAYIKIVGDIPLTEGWRMSIDSIANPQSQVVHYCPGIDEYSKQYMCGISSQWLLDEGYSAILDSDGRPYKLNDVYSRGLVTLNFTEEVPIYVDYTYYRNHNNDEYLHFDFHFNNGNHEYRNYWLVDQKIYRDTIYAYCTGDGMREPIQKHLGDEFNRYYSPDYYWKPVWDEDYVADRPGTPGQMLVVTDKSMLADCTIETENGSTHYYITENSKPIDYMTERGGIVEGISNLSVFNSNLSDFRNIIGQSIGILGKGLDINNVSSIVWNPGYTLTANNVRSDKIGEKELTVQQNWAGYNFDTYRKYSYEQVDNMFYYLRQDKAFDVDVLVGLNGSVTIQFADGHTQQYDGETEISESFNYGDIITLTAVPDEGCEFIGWDDGNTNPGRTIMVTEYTPLRANFARVYTVTDAEELDNALNDMVEGGEYVVYINSDEKIYTYIYLRGDKKVTFIGNGSATILGFDESKFDGLDSDDKGSKGVFDVRKNSNVTIKNLTIDGSYDDKKTNGINIGNSYPPILTLDNVNIQNCDRGVYCSFNCNVNISQSEIKGNGSGLTIYRANDVKVTISGGTVKGNKDTKSTEPHNEQSDKIDVDIFVYSTNIDLTITDHATVGTISLYDYNGNYSQPIKVGDLANSSTEPIIVTSYTISDPSANVGGFYYRAYTDVDMSVLNGKQLLQNASPQANLAEGIAKFRLATHDYFIDAEGIIRQSYEFDASGDDFGLEELQTAIEGTPSTARASAIYIAKDFNNNTDPSLRVTGIYNLINETPDGCTLLIDSDLSLSGGGSMETITSGNKKFGLTSDHSMSSSSQSYFFKVATGGSLTLVSGSFRPSGISAAIVIDGGTFTVCDGVTISGGTYYSDGIQMDSGKLNIKGGIFTNFRQNAAIIVNDGDVEITGGTIQNCSCSGGLKLSGGSGIIKNLRLINNSGSGVYITGGNYEFENCTFNDNAYSGGSAKISYGLCVRVGGGTASFNKCSISNNRVVAGGYCDMYGVGAYITSGIASFNNCTISNNYMIIKEVESGICNNNNLYGVGLYAEQEDGKTTNLTIGNTTISDNNIVISEDEVVTEEDEVVTMDNYQEGDENPNPHDGIQYLIKAGVNYNGTVLEEDLKQN